VITTSHPQALHSFARRLHTLFILRATVQFATVWLFVWGVVVLALRMGGAQNTFWLALGWLGLLPLGLLAIWQARRQQPAFAKIRATYDRHNACGGVLMAQESADMTAWLTQLPAAAVPELRWRSGRPLLLLAIAALFATAALLLPERLMNLAGHKTLQIGQIVEQLQAEVQTLAQEKIVPEQQADEVQKQLAQLQKDSSSYDPNKTWEALDHIKEANANAAKQAAEEALTKTASLAQAETLARAMEQAAEAGMTEATAAEAAQSLAAMLNSAKLEAGILNGKIPPELLAGLNGLNKEQMEQLMKALELNKSLLGATITNLAHLKLVDGNALSRCNKAGNCSNTNALAVYLANCKDGKCDHASLMACLQCLRPGGPGGGGPAAPMTWSDGTSEQDTKFQEHALPSASNLSQAQLVGVSQGAPELSVATLATGQGALDNTAASGGSAHAQVILPEHRQAVQQFFKREGK